MFLALLLAGCGEGDPPARRRIDIDVDSSSCVQKRCVIDRYDFYLLRHDGATLCLLEQATAQPAGQDLVLASDRLAQDGQEVVLTLKSYCAPAKCGNNLCEDAESCQDCPADCDCRCGDGYCSYTLTETQYSCPDDCITCTTAKLCSRCGNGSCEEAFGERCGTCPKDCGTCPPGCPNCFGIEKLRALQGERTTLKPFGASSCSFPLDSLMKLDLPAEEPFPPTTPCR